MHVHPSVADCLVGYGFLAIHRSFATSRHYPLNILTESLIFSCWYQVFYFHMAADWFLTISALSTTGLDSTYCQPLLALITFSNDQIYHMLAIDIHVHAFFILTSSYPLYFFSYTLVNPDNTKMLQQFHRKRTKILSLRVIILRFKHLI